MQWESAVLFVAGVPGEGRQVGQRHVGGECDDGRRQQQRGVDETAAGSGCGGE